jgi:hypothetical protein
MTTTALVRRYLPGVLSHLAIGVLVLGWGAAAMPHFGRAADDPKAFVQGIGDQVVKVLKQNLPREKVGEQLNAIWLQAFDVGGIAITATA